VPFVSLPWGNTYYVDALPHSLAERGSVPVWSRIPVSGRIPRTPLRDLSLCFIKVLKIFNYLFEHLAFCIGGRSPGTSQVHSRGNRWGTFPRGRDYPAPGRKLAEMCRRRITSRLVTYSKKCAKRAISVKSPPAFYLCL
jgi:hypothetical protein